MPDSRDVNTMRTDVEQVGTMVALLQSRIAAELDKDDIAEMDEKELVKQYLKLKRVFDAMKDFVEAAMDTSPKKRLRARPSDGC